MASKVDFEDSGDGPAILFVPGSFGTTAAWRGVQKHLPPDYRCINTSLLGYGGTTETRTLDNADIGLEIDALAHTARRIGEPVHLVAHSFGGAVALAAILRGAVPIHSLAIFEAAVVSLLPQDSSGNAPDAFPTAARRTSDEFEMAHNRGEKDAVKIVIDYWGGEGAFDALPGAAQDYCRETAGSNVLDWRTVFGFTATDTDLATLTAPTLVVRGEHASPSMRAITQTLQDNLPNAQSTVVGGANHFLTATHAAACASVLLEFWNALPD